MPTELNEEGHLAAETGPLRTQLADLQSLARGFGRALTTAFRSAALDGKRLKDVLRSLTLGLSRRALNQALAPIGRGIGSFLANAVGNLLSGGAQFARGGVVGAGVTPFAAGGVIATPSFFPMRRGLGLVGEAGPEAILPLARGPDGRLGVRSQGSSGVNVTFNVTTPDAPSFRRAEAEINAMLARVVARGRRGM